VPPESDVRAAQAGTPPTPSEAPPPQPGPRESRRAERGTVTEPRLDRAVDADLLIDVPQLAVEELNLELEASLLLKHLKVDAKGLEAGLFLKADFDNLAALSGKRPSSDQPAADVRSASVAGIRGAAPARVRTGLRELLGSTRDAYRDLSDRDVQQQLRDVHESAREAYAHVAGGEESSTRAQEQGDEDEQEAGSDGSRVQAMGNRVLHAAMHGGKAAGLTAAGLAGGALLESRAQPSRRLPIPRRRSRAQAIAHDVRRRLP
jgi:hypothetical protein